MKIEKTKKPGSKTINYKEAKENRELINKALNVFHLVNMNELNTVSNYNVSKYKNSSFTFREIKDELNQALTLLNDEKSLMAIVLLRNVYEDMIYFFATIIDSSIKVDVKTSPKDLRDVVKNNSNTYFDNLFVEEDFDEFYRYLSKMVHVTSIKECISFLDSKSRYKPFIITEIKCVAIIFECMLMQFLNSIGKYNSDLYEDTLFVVSSCSIANSIMFVATFKNKHNRKINDYFHDPRSQSYFNDRITNIQNDLSFLIAESKKYNEAINKKTKELSKKYKELGYEEMINNELLTNSKELSN